MKKYPNSAVVLIEFQNQWTRKGLYHWLLKKEINRLNSIDKAVALVNWARENGVPVIHAPLVIDPKNKRGLFAYLSMGLVFRKGTTAAQLDSRVYEASNDIIANGRTAFDAFVNSELDKKLAEVNAKNVYFAGFATDQCVAKTARTALKKGYSATVVSDACAAFLTVLQKRVEEKFPGNVSTVAQLTNNG